MADTLFAMLHDHMTGRQEKVAVPEELMQYGWAGRRTNWENPYTAVAADPLEAWLIAQLLQLRGNPGDDPNIGGVIESV